MDHVLLSRIQFAFTAMFHILWPVLTVGLSLYLVWVEALWLRTGDRDYLRQAKFWGKIFLINFALGIVTGITLEFQFGTNWSSYSWFVGDIFGAPLAIEGIMAFFMVISLFMLKRIKVGDFQKNINKTTVLERAAIVVD